MSLLQSDGVIARATANIQHFVDGTANATGNLSDQLHGQSGINHADLTGFRVEKTLKVLIKMLLHYGKC